MAIPTPYTFEEEVIDRLARIETSTMADKKASDDQEERLRSLEHRQWFLAGAVALLSTAIPFLTKLGAHFP